MLFKKHPILISIGAILIGLIGTWAIQKVRSIQPTEVYHPKKGNITEAIYGLGKVRSHKRFDVRMGVTTTVEKLFVKEGDSVPKGGRLIQFESNVILRAPFSGTITAIHMNEGETALPQIPVLTIEDLSDLYIEVALEQESALRVRKNQKATASFETLRGLRLEGTVHALFPKNDEFLAHLSIPDFPESILPGMSADIAIEVGTIENALLIPLKALSNGMVVVRRNGKKEKLKLQIGHVDDQWAEVQNSDLKESDEILTRAK